MNRILIFTAAVALLAGAAFAQKKPPAIKSQKEAEAWQAIVTAQTPDARIKAVNDFITNFADTDLKSMALFAAAQSYEQKNDSDNVIVYGQRAVEADPDNFEAALLLAGTTAQRSREFDLDREEKLTRAEKYASSALDTIAKAEKPNPQITDEQWASYKKEVTAQAHERLGMIADKRKKYDVAVSEYKAAIDLAPDNQSSFIRLAATYTAAGKPDEAIATLEKLSAMPNLNPALKPFIEQERKKATAVKAGAAKPAAAPTPAPAPAAPKQ